MPIKIYENDNAIIKKYFYNLRTLKKDLNFYFIFANSIWAAVTMLLSQKNKTEKQCSRCRKSFLIESHFQSSRRSEPTKTCKFCRDMKINSNNKPTSSVQKRANIYLYHKRKEIEKNRGCQWPGCRFNFTHNSDTFVVCDEIENIVIFEFDHLEEKLFCVSDWCYYPGRYDDQDLVHEIAKCRILCRFHHQIHSENQRNEKKKNEVYSDANKATRERKNRRENGEKLQKLKLDPERFGKCLLCECPVLKGETAGFEFDHIDPLEKYWAISEMVTRGFSWENRILPEIEKCRLLCANCHRIYTLEQNEDEDLKNVCRKRKHYYRSRNIDKEELEIREKGERPTKEELYELVSKYSFVDVGMLYRVSCKTIVNWCNKEEIPHTHKRRKLMGELMEQIE